MLQKLTLSPKTNFCQNMLLFLAFPVEHLCAGGTQVGVGASCPWLVELLGESSLPMSLPDFPGDVQPGGWECRQLPGS